MKENNVKEVVKSAEVKAKRARQNFAQAYIKQIDKRAKSINQVEYFEIRNNILNELNKIEKLLNEVKLQNRREKAIAKTLSQYSEKDIRNYLSKINEVKK